MWRVTRKLKMTEQKRFKHISTRPVPYTTKTGVQIGRFYEPPRQQMTYEGEHIQSVLLGIKHSAYPTRQKMEMVAYMAAYVALLVRIAMVVGK